MILDGIENIIVLFSDAPMHTRPADSVNVGVLAVDSIEKCKTFVGESIPVIRKDGFLQGVVTEGDLFQIFLKITKEEKKMDHEN